MDKKIISFNLAKRQRDKHRGKVPHNTSFLNSHHHHDLHPIIEYEYTLLIKRLRTKGLKYKYPTVLSGYRKEINPVDALYQNLQESLFKYDPNNEFCMWVISLFGDKVWLAGLIHDLEADCYSITEFQNRHRSTTGLNKFRVLGDIKTNFQHYIKLFTLMQEWD